MKKGDDNNKKELTLYFTQEGEKWKINFLKTEEELTSS